MCISRVDLGEKSGGAGQSIFPQDCRPCWQKGFSKLDSDEIL